MFNPASPVTGAPITGFTSPTYTIAAGTPRDVNGVAKYVTALGGTQAGVVISSASIPFTSEFRAPKQIRTLQPLNGNGALPNVPINVWSLDTFKGVVPLAGQPAFRGYVKTQFGLPAGADTADKANFLAALSFHIGLLWEQSNEIGDSIIAGTL